MPPSVDTQREIGAKMSIGKTFLTAALFDIKKPSYTYTLNNDSSAYTFDTAGREEHKGIEVSISGKVTDQLTLYGGFTIFSAEITQNPTNPRLVGMRPANVAEQMAKLYAEYDVARIPGLTITGGVYFTGKQAVNSLNTEYMPGCTIFDLGARYAAKINNTPVTYRLNIANLFNKQYWVSSIYTGYPRTVSLSMEMKL
jgi:iron complex outermembrane receptor protein